MKRILFVLASMGLAGFLFASPFDFPSSGGGGTATWPVSGTPAGFADGIDDTAAPGNNPVSDDSAGNVYVTTTTNNMGIGTTSPNGYTLNVAGDAQVTSTMTVVGSAYLNSGAVLGGTPASFVTSGSAFTLGVGGSTPYLQNATSGYFNTTLFGIGTTSPLASLHVVGDSALGTSILSNGAAGTNPTFERYLISGTSKLLIGAAASNNNFGIGITTGDSFMVTVATTNGIGFYSGQSVTSAPNLWIKTTGTSPQVAIGTTTVGDVLSVAGGVQATTGTFTGASFSVGLTTFVITAGQIGIGTTSPTAGAQIDATGIARFQGGYFGSTYTTGGSWQYNSGLDSFLMNGIPGKTTWLNSFKTNITTAAGNTGDIFTVSTGAVSLFNVNGTSVALKVPLNMNSQPIQNVGSISGSGTGRISLVDTANSSMTFVTIGGTLTLTTQGLVTSATTAEIGNTSNLIALQLGASSATFNENMRSTGTVTATKFIDSSSNIVAKGTQTWVFEITTGTLAAGSTWQIGIAPDDTAITITRVRAASFSVAASTINFSLWGRSTPNGANTTIFNNTISSGCWTETSTTTFSSNSIAAGSGLYFSPPSGGATFQAGTTSGLKIIVDYLFAQ